MQTRTKFTATTVALTILLMAFHPMGPAGAVLWPQPAPDAVPPPAWTLPLFLLLFLVEAAVSAFGVAFLAFGRGFTRGLLPERPRFARAVHVSLAYLLIQWWPHGNLHISVPFSFARILAIDYAFHVPIIVASLVLVAGLAQASARRRVPAEGA